MGTFLNSVIGRLSATQAKINGLNQRLLNLCMQATTTRTEPAKGRGKLGYCEQVIPDLSAVPAEFTRASEHGATQPIKWDQSVPVSPRLQAALEYALTTIALRQQ